MSDMQRPTSDGSELQEFSGWRLTPDDSLALDALVDAGFEIARVPAELRDRAERVAAAMGLLGLVHQTADVETMVDAVLARVRLHDQRTGPRDFALSGNDEDALELLIAAEYVAEAVPTVLRKRAERQGRLLGLLEPARSEAKSSGDLIGRTLARIQASINGREERMRMQPEAAPGRRFRMADLITVAAMLLIATAAVGPMVGAFREQSRRMACQSNLQAAGLGFGNYAGEYRDAMPMASAASPGTPWWFVGKPGESNSANLFTLARTGYTKVDQLACAGNPSACRSTPDPQDHDWRSLDEVSYSYQNMFGGGQPLLRGKPGTLHLIIAVDGSPVVRRAILKQRINPLANSMNHEGAGQNALYNDGRVEWLSSPVLSNGEHIWLPHVIERGIALLRQPTQAEPIKGIETPGGADDVFVGP